MFPLSPGPVSRLAASNEISKAVRAMSQSTALASLRVRQELERARCCIGLLWRTPRRCRALRTCSARLSDFLLVAANQVTCLRTTVNTAPVGGRGMGGGLKVPPTTQPHGNRTPFRKCPWYAP